MTRRWFPSTSRPVLDRAASHGSSAAYMQQHLFPPSSAPIHMAVIDLSMLHWFFGYRHVFTIA